LSDGFIEQMELAVGSFSRINEGIRALVDGVKKLVEAMRKKEVLKMARDQEIVEVGVQTVEKPEIEKVDKEIEMEMTAEGDKGDKVKKEDGDQETEEVGKE
jgi:hypothetical protein